MRNTRRLAIGIVAGILIGSALLAFVSFQIMDSLHMGTAESEVLALTAAKTDGHWNLTYTPTKLPTFMQQKTGHAYNGTAPIVAGKITLASPGTGKYIFADYIKAKDGAGGAYRNDTLYLVANYTTVGGEVRPFITPVTILVSIMAIIITATVMMGALGGTKNKGGRKSFP